MPISMTKIRHNHQFPQEKFVSHFPFLERLPERFTNSFADLLIKEFWNLISWQYFGVYWVNGLYNGNYGQWYIQAVWEASIPVWVPKLWHAKNTFQVFFFQLYFSKSYIDVAINDLTKHLIISKWLIRQIYIQKKKTMRQDVKAKEEIVYKSVFIHLNTL